MGPGGGRGGWKTSRGEMQQHGVQGRYLKKTTDQNTVTPPKIPTKNITDKQKPNQNKKDQPQNPHTLNATHFQICLQSKPPSSLWIVSHRFQTGTGPILTLSVTVQKHPKTGHESWHDAQTLLAVIFSYGVLHVHKVYRQVQWAAAKPPLLWEETYLHVTRAHTFRV